VSKNAIIYNVTASVMPPPLLLFLLVLLSVFVDVTPG